MDLEHLVRMAARLGLIMVISGLILGLTGAGMIGFWGGGEGMEKVYPLFILSGAGLVLYVVAQLIGSRLGD
jgi:hypothetical protein